MDKELGVLAKYEVEKLMRKMSRERSRRIQELIRKAHNLEVDGELYQPYLSCLPSVEELSMMLNENDTKRYRVYETINGIMIIRTL